MRLPTFVTTALVALALPAAAAAAPPDWTAVEPLGSGLSDHIDVAVNDAGHAVAAWSRDIGPRDAVYVTTRAPGQPWAPAVELTSASQPGYSVVNSTEPLEVAIDADGDAFVIWVADTAGGGEHALGAGKPASGGWEPVAEIDGGATMGVRGPDAVFAPDGALHVAYGRDDAPGGNGFVVRARQRSAGGVWSAVEPLSVGAAVNANSVRLGTDAAGNVMAIWNRANTGVQALTRTPADTEWPEPATAVTISPSTSTFEPRLAVAPDGRAVAVWAEGADTAKLDIKSQLRPAGGAWPAAANASTVSPGAVQGNSHPEVDIAADGAVAVAWERATGTINKEEVRAKVRLPGADWPIGVGEILSAASEDAELPVVGMDAAHNATVVWRSGNPAVTRISVRNAGDQLFAAPADNTIATSDTYGHALDMNSSGNAALLWASYVDGSDDWTVESALRDVVAPHQLDLDGTKSVADGTAATLTAVAADGFSGVRDVTWTFAGGGTAKGTSVQHTFPGPGNWGVIATVTDRAGRERKAPMVVSVVAKPSSGGGGGGQGGGGAGGGGGRGGVLARDLLGPKVSVTPARPRVDRKRRVRLTVACPAGETACSFGLTLRSAKAERLRRGARKRRLALGSAARLSARGGRSATATLTLPRAAYGLLRRRGRLSASIEVVARDAAGNVARTSRTVTLLASRGR